MPAHLSIKINDNNQSPTEKSFQTYSISKDFFRYRELVSDLPRSRAQGLSQLPPEPAARGWLCPAGEENLPALTNFSRF